MSKYDTLLALKPGSIREIRTDNGRLAIASELGGRVFTELCGYSLHRIDLEHAVDTGPDFHNIGGNNFWPAPEGGPLGFNYRGNEWYVQDSINRQPFEVTSSSVNSISISKTIPLINRAGTMIETEMTREVTLERELPMLSGYAVEGSISYKTHDSLRILNPVSINEGLIASWSLEQFEASDNTVAFCQTEAPRQSINLDYYDDPGSRIAYTDTGFIYKTDGLSKGQIGIKKASQADCIGFYDFSAKLLCIRKNITKSGGVYFNIADNDQPQGPYSAADNYSIFNSDSGLFELETIGPAHINADKQLIGSELISITTFAVFTDADELKKLINKLLAFDAK